MKARLTRIALLVVFLFVFVGVAFAGTTLTRGVEVFQVSCASGSATQIKEAATDGHNSIRCWNGSVSGGTATENTDVVCIGGSDVDITTNCYPICSTSSGCPESAITFDATLGAGLYCRSASGSAETITCVAGE